MIGQREGRPSASLPLSRCLLLYHSKSDTVQKYKGTIYDASRDQSDTKWYKDNVELRLSDAIDKSKRIEYQADLLRKNIISFKRRLKVNLEEQIKLIDEIEIIDVENN